jgi:hypothetical protein
MFDRKRRISAKIVGLGVGLAAIAASAGPATSTDAPLSCAIEATAAGGAIALESKVETDVALSGSYRFRVESAGYAGSTKFQQGGGFAAGPGNAVTLGRIMLGDASALYDATLEIAAAGTAVTCTKRVGGKI